MSAKKMISGAASSKKIDAVRRWAREQTQSKHKGLGSFAPKSKGISKEEASSLLGKKVASAGFWGGFEKQAGVKKRIARRYTGKHKMNHVDFHDASGKPATTIGKKPLFDEQGNLRYMGGELVHGPRENIGFKVPKRPPKGER